MKEVTKWDNNPREMWVWNDDESEKKKRFVVIVESGLNEQYPVFVTHNYIGENYKHCAEIEELETRRMTNKELAWWLRAEPTREYKLGSSSTANIYCWHVYDEYTADEEVDPNVLIRENGGEWREPLVEVEE